MKYITDEPIDFNETDFLGSKTYSDLLRQIINDSPKNKSYTIGLFGEWGSGKSSIIETTINAFKNSSTKFVTYDSWKYSNDSFRRTFLIQIFKQLYPSKKIEEINELLYADLSKSRIKLENIPVAVVDGILSKAIYNKNIFNMNEIVQESHYFSPEQFESKFKEVIEEFQKSYKTQKIVIVIDNVDRCSSQHAYHLLSDIKSFLDIPNVIFLIPVDDNALSGQISQHGDKPSEFLRKIFNAALYIKPLKTTELFAFTRSLSEKEGLNLDIDTIYILSEAYATNPRRIVQLLNNLQIELAFFDRYENLQKNHEFSEEKSSGNLELKCNFSKKYEKAICKLLVIREEWPEFYFEIAHKPELLWHNTSINSEDSDLRRNMLKEFLNNTGSVTKPEEDDLIYRLTTLKDPFSEIPKSIILDLESGVYNNIFSYIAKGEHEFTLFVTFLINRLEVKIRTASIQVVANEFDNLLKINEIKSIVKFDEKIENCVNNLRFNSPYRTGDPLSYFILNLKYIEGLLRYGHELNQRNKKYLCDNIISVLEWPERGSQDVYKTYKNEYINLFLKYVDIYPEACCRRIQKGFAAMVGEILGFDYFLGSATKIPLEKVNYLISDKLIQVYIKKIGWNSLDTDEIIKNPVDGFSKGIETMKNSMTNILYISKIYEINKEDIKSLESTLNYCLINFDDSENDLKSFVKDWEKSINNYIHEKIKLNYQN